jgi:hypothetical protein
MVILKFDISNVFDSLCVRLVLHVLSDKVSRDYECDIKVDEDFETLLRVTRSYLRGVVVMYVLHSCNGVTRRDCVEGEIRTV